MFHYSVEELYSKNSHTRVNGKQSVRPYLDLMSYIHIAYAHAFNIIITVLKQFPETWQCFEAILYYLVLLTVVNLLLYSLVVSPSVVMFFFVFFFLELASHVRRVRVPSQASDVDQYLDDLFNPVLDQLSDARSLAASIKGSSSRSKSVDDCESLDSREFAKTIKGGGSRRIAETNSPLEVVDERPDEKDKRANDLQVGEVYELPLDVAMFAKTVKGGGRGVASQQQVCTAEHYYEFPLCIITLWMEPLAIIDGVFGFPHFHVGRLWFLSIDEGRGIGKRVGDVVYDQTINMRFTLVITDCAF